MKKTLLFLVLIALSGIVSAQVETGLIAKYSFNDQNTLDESGNSNDGTSYNLTAAQDRFGNPNKAFAFNGTDSYIDLPSSLLLTQDISISLWFKTAVDSGCIIGHQNQSIGNTPSQYVPISYMRLDSSVNVALWEGTVTNRNNSALKFNDDEWHHLVVTGANNSQEVYIDGVDVGLGIGYNLLSSLTYNQIGTGYVSGGWPSQAGLGWSYFNGNIDDVRIYNRVINATEVDSLFEIENPFVLVNSITVQGEGGVSTITTNGGTLQMEADVLPMNADDVTYTWSVVNGTGAASIDANGLLTASADGDVEVTATANDGTGVTGSATITISNQGVGIKDISFDNLNLYPNPTTGIVNIAVENEEITYIKVIDLAGRVIKQYGNESQINVSDVTTGIYMLEIANEEKRSIVKLIVR